MTLPGRSFPPTAAEQLHRIEIGDVTVVPVVQFHYRVDPAKFFPELPERGVDEAAWYWQQPYLDDGHLVVDMGGFLLRTPDRTVLVDAGIGNGKTRLNPNFDHRDDPWLDRLRAAGAEPEDVDTVVFTHLHVDHVGNATCYDGKSWQPVFTNARHLVTPKELAYWTSAESRTQLARFGDYVTDSVLPLRQAGLLDEAAPDLQICPEIRLVPAQGHTPGNVCVEVSSGGQRAVFAGDMVHHGLQLAYPDWSTDYCVDRCGAADARVAMLESIADTDTLLFPAHFPQSLPGRITRAENGGYRYHTEFGQLV